MNQSPLPLKIILIALVIIMSACSNTASTKTDNSGNDPTITDVPVITFDTEKPTSYTEYKRWRKTNAPSSEAYADYKAWEIAYRRWQAQQEEQ